MTLDQIDKCLRSLSPDQHLDIIMVSRLSQNAKDDINLESFLSGRFPMLLLKRSSPGLGNIEKIDIYICFYKDSKYYYTRSQGFATAKSSHYNPYLFAPIDSFTPGIIKYMREYKLSELIQ